MNRQKSRRFFLMMGAALLLSAGIRPNALAQDTSARESTSTTITGDVPEDTQSILRRLPANSAYVMTLDTGDDNPSMEFAHPARPTDEGDAASYAMLQVMQKDVRDGFFRILRLFGLDSSVFEQLGSAVGPRYVVAVAPPEKGSIPNVLFLARIRDREAAEKQLHRLIGSVARNATETVTEVGDSRLHTWSRLIDLDTMGISKMTLNYVVGDDMMAISNDATTLRAAATNTSGQIPNWLPQLLNHSPRGLINFYGSPNLPELFGNMAGASPFNMKDMGFGGSVSSITLTREGIDLSGAAFIDSKGRLGKVFAKAGDIPAVSDESFRKIPNGSLMALGVSRPSAWMKAVQDSLPEDASNLGLPFLSLLPTLFDGDVTVAVRSLLPLPSGIVTVSADSPEAANERMGAIRTFARQIQADVREVTETGGRKVTTIKVGAGPYANAYIAQQGNTVVASTDRRSLEEAENREGDADSILDDDNFQTVRRHLGENPHLVFYADLSEMSGAGMILSHFFFQGSPVGAELARLFRSLNGFGAGVRLYPDRYEVHEFIAGDPARLLPAIGGLTVAGTGAGIAFAVPAMMTSKEEARATSCQSNLKQIALAAMMYAQDYNEVMPRASQWPQQLKIYVKNTEVLHCPSDEGARISYAMNQKLSKIPLSQISDPSKTILFYETSEGGSSPNGIGDNQAMRHDGSIIVAYADGHTERLYRSLTADDFKVVRGPAPSPKTNVSSGMAAPRNGSKPSATRKNTSKRAKVKSRAGRSHAR